MTTNQDKIDAARYRWLRAQHWSNSEIAVVTQPKVSVKLGYLCPSGLLLDKIIDTKMKSSQPEPTQEQKPLGEKDPQPSEKEETWKSYGPNPNIEINSKGQLRTKPDSSK